MSESMVERVARASHEFFRPLYKLPPWEDIPDTHKSVGLQHARALLATMRESTPGMWPAGGRTQPVEPWNDLEPEMWARIQWAAMIDAALSGA